MDTPRSRPRSWYSSHPTHGLLHEVYTRIPDIDAAEPDFLVANFIHGIKRLPARWTPETQTGITARGPGPNATGC